MAAFPAPPPKSGRAGIHPKSAGPGPAKAMFHNLHYANREKLRNWCVIFHIPVGMPKFSLCYEEVILSDFGASPCGH